MAVLSGVRLRQMECGKCKFIRKGNVPAPLANGTRENNGYGASPQFQLASFINFSNLNFCHLNVHNRRRGARPPLSECVCCLLVPRIIKLRARDIIALVIKMMTLLQQQRYALARSRLVCLPFAPNVAKQASTTGVILEA